MLRWILRAAAKTHHHHHHPETQLPQLWNPTTTTTTTRPPPNSPVFLTPSFNQYKYCYASKSKGNKDHQKPKNNESYKGNVPDNKSAPSDGAAASPTPSSSPKADHQASLREELAARRRFLADDEKNPRLDVGPNGLPLFTSAPSLSLLTRQDACTYFRFSEDALKSYLPEGLPTGMVKEFEESLRKALLVRHSFLDLRDNFRRIVDPPLQSSHGKGRTVRKQIVLDGPLSCGKSITLAMLVYWAREEGWLVLYAPRGRDWTHGGFFYKNPQTGLWDTPLHAKNVLQDFLKYNGSCLKDLPCHILDPVPLGEGAGVGWMKGIESMPVVEGSTLYDLVQMGIQHTHAAVGAVVRLRKELSLVKDVPVLIAIDQYNNWFTFSEFEEPVNMHSCRPIHAKELAMVNAFRSMKHDDMMVGAFSHSTAVGKLRKELPDVPEGARVDLPRYTLEEAATVSHYYLRQRLIPREAFSNENWKKVYYLTNGNGAEMRLLSRLMQ